MEAFKIREYSFIYPKRQTPALSGVSLDIHQGEILAVCGQSGSGKSTLLRCLKPVLTPHGGSSGAIEFMGKPLESLEQREEASRIGFVLQNPDAQIVTDKVWHELAFGLESLGLDTKTIRLRVSEMASFFGIQTWYHKDVNELSGGQKQLLNLAAVMAMQPDVLIMDEPTSQLDPIAAREFLDVVRKVNSELGTTIIISEHRLEDVIPMSDRMLVLHRGRAIACDEPSHVIAKLASEHHPMFEAMPAPERAYYLASASGVAGTSECPHDVKSGRAWIDSALESASEIKTRIDGEEKAPDSSIAVELKDVWFKYGKKDDYVVKGLNLQARKGELYCIVGGNGTGKTTSANLIAGIRKPQRGSIRVNGSVAMLPQNPQTVFVRESVHDDLVEMAKHMKFKDVERAVSDAAAIVDIEELLDAHPYDLSGGEQQRAALAKVLMMAPDILILDEPTKGLDNEFKNRLAKILGKLLADGTTIIMVSHDIEFCAKFGDRCAMFFDGNVITENAPRAFFSGNSFYTTQANRMSRHVFENAVTAEDVVKLVLESNGMEASGIDEQDEPDDEPGNDDGEEDAFGREESMKNLTVPDAPLNFQQEESPKGTWILELIMIALAAATTYVGIFRFEERHYMIVALLVILYTMIPRFSNFEKRKPKSREIVIIAVLVATAVAGRAAFFMIPNFKPILAIVIIAGVALGREDGFLVGALAAFVSNFIFGQGPWTPWQMIAMAIIGYLAGLIFHRLAGAICQGNRVTQGLLIAFGTLAVFFIYGAIVDIWTIFVMTPEPTMGTVIAVYTAAFYFNLVHAGATALFLTILAGPMIRKINRVQIKYGL